MNTLEEFSKYLSYLPESGCFVWTKTRTGKVKIGSIAGGKSRDGYMRIVFRGREYRTHRLVWLFEKGVWPSKNIDHIDGNRLNNIISNLRDVNQSVNQQNKRKESTANKSSGLLGVTWHKSCRKWQASICIDGKAKYLGLFEDKYQAQKVYIDAKRIMHEGCTL